MLRCFLWLGERLHIWKRNFGVKATYAKLLKACVESTNAEAADAIVDVLNGKCSEFKEDIGRAKCTQSKIPYHSKQPHQTGMHSLKVD